MPTQFERLLTRGFREQRTQNPCTIVAGAVTKTGTRTAFEINEEVRVNGKRYYIDAQISVEEADFTDLNISEGQEFTADGKTVRLMRLAKDCGFIKMTVGAPR